MDWIEKIKALTVGYSEVNYKGERFGVSKTAFNAGKSMKVYAKELGGIRFISFNYYCTSKENLLKPCEMPLADVLHFLENYTFIINDGASGKRI